MISEINEQQEPSPPQSILGDEQDIMELLQKSMILNKNEKEETIVEPGVHRFIHGAIRAEDLEKSFGPSSRPPPQMGPPPPGFVSHLENQCLPLNLDPFRANNSNGINANHRYPPIYNPQHFPHLAVPTSNEMGENNNLEHLLGVPLLLPPPAMVLPSHHPNIGVGTGVLNEGSLLGVPRQLLHSGPLGSPSGYILPFGIRAGFFQENQKGFMNDDPINASSQLIPNHSSKRN